MKVPEQQIRIVAADPIEVGNQRLLPSVLVNTTSARWPKRGMFHWIRVRPVSVVVEGPEGATWHEVPNETAHAISSMVAAGLSIAAAAIAIIAIARLVRRG